MYGERMTCAIKQKNNKYLKNKALNGTGKSDA